MADQPTRENAEPKKDGSKKGRLGTILVVGVLMLVEGVAIYLAVDFFTDDPAAAAAGAVAEAEAQGQAAQPPKDDTAELEVAQCRSTNSKEGRVYHYSIRVSVLVPESELERLTALVEKRRSRIDERVNIVVRSAEPKQLREPGFESLKRRLRAELTEVFKDDNKLILDVFIPELIRTGGGD